MEFALSQEQELFRSYVRKFLDDKGQTEIARDFIDGKTGASKHALAGLAKLGCTSITISETYGGMELGPLDLVPVMEEIGKSLLPGVYMETMSFAVPVIEKYGTAAQKEKYLPGIAEGTRKVSLAWLEPEKGFQPEEISVTANRQDGELIIEGIKTLVPTDAQADTYLVMVKMEAGLALAIVEDGEVTEKDALKTIDETRQLSILTFSNVAVPESRLIGEPGGGWAILQHGLLHLNAALCSMMVGGMERVVEMANEYAKIRVQFGQPIGRFQSIKHKIVDMKMDLETARSLSHYANWALENETEDYEAAIYSARAFATEAFIKIASDNIQIHGGIGFTEEIDCHLYVKRARFYENYVGTVRSSREKAGVALGW